MLAAALVTVLILLLPGAVLGILAGLRPWTALATSAPIVLGLAGFTAWGAAAMNVPYSWQPLLAVWLIACAVAFIVRMLLPTVATPERREAFGTIRSYSRIPRSSSALTAAFAFATSVVGSLRFLFLLNDAPGGGAGHIREAWDMQWHTNFLRFIEETGMASSLAAGELSNQETHAAHFYPSAWHAVAALLPGDVFVQANVFAFLAPMVIFPAGVAALARTVSGPRWAAVAGPVAAVLTLASSEVWIALLRTSSMPYLLAVAALPAALTLVLRGYTFPALIALAGLMYTHPAAAVSAALVALLWLLTQPSLDALLRLVAMGIFSALLVLPILQGAADEGESVAEFYGQIDITRAESIWRTFNGMASHTENADFPVYILILTLFGAGVLLIRRHPWTPWPVLLMLLLGVVSDSAQLRWAQPWGGYLKVLGTVYYDMPYRIQAVIGVLRIVCQSIAIAFIVWAGVQLVQKIRSSSKSEAKHSLHDAHQFADEGSVGERGVGKRAVATQMVLVGVLAAALLVPASWTNSSLMRSVVHTGDHRKTHMRPEVLQALDWLAQQPKARDGLIVNNNGEGTGWMYAYNGLPALFRHFSWSDKSATTTHNLIGNVDLLTSKNDGAAVDANRFDAAAASLRAHYVFVSPPSEGTDQAMALSQRSWAWWAPGLTPVYQDGAVTIFAVNRHFSAAELNKLKSTSPKRPTDPNPLWTPPRQPIIGPAGEANPLAGARVDFGMNDEAIRELNEQVENSHQLVPNAEGKLNASQKQALAAIEHQVRTKLENSGAILVDTDDGTIDEDIASKTTGVGNQYPQAGDGSTRDIADEGDYSSAAESGTQARIVAGFSATGPVTRHFGVSALIDSKLPSERNASQWQLAAGLRDALVFRGFGVHSTYGQPEDANGKFREGLSPDVDANHTGIAPTAALTFGSLDNKKLLADIVKPQIQEAIANAIVDGIASMLRQHSR